MKKHSYEYRGKSHDKRALMLIHMPIEIGK